jgi:hypothetical protein
MRRGRHREGQEFSTGIESSDLRGSGFSLTMAKPVLTVRRAEADYREKELKKNRDAFELEEVASPGMIRLHALSLLCVLLRYSEFLLCLATTALKHRQAPRRSGER